MSYNYSPLQDTAKRLIQKFGRQIFILTKTAVYEAWNPELSWAQSAAIGVNVGQNKSERDNELIQSSDSVFLIESSVAVSTENRLLDGNDEFSIIAVTELKPGDTTLLYRVIARK